MFNLFVRFLAVYSYARNNERIFQERLAFTPMESPPLQVVYIELAPEQIAALRLEAGWREESIDAVRK